jgi:hypothetical protein
VCGKSPTWIIPRPPFYRIGRGEAGLIIQPFEPQASQAGPVSPQESGHPPDRSVDHNPALPMIKAGLDGLGDAKADFVAGLLKGQCVIEPGCEFHRMCLSCERMLGMSLDFPSVPSGHRPADRQSAHAGRLARPVSGRKSAPPRRRMPRQKPPEAFAARFLGRGVSSIDRPKFARARLEYRPAIWPKTSAHKNSPCQH